MSAGATCCWGKLSPLAPRPDGSCLDTCPVVYVEPYVMNSRSAFARIQAGDDSGKRVFDGILRQSIYREYADGIADGLVNNYTHR